MSSRAMLSPGIQASNILLTIARLNGLINSHLREIMCCHKELMLCMADPTSNAHEREALEIQINSLNVDVVQWRAEIQHYIEQYEQLVSEQSAPISA
jgi:hypothetical protein